MCLSIPGKVTEIKKNKFIISYGKEKKEAVQSIIDVKKGDYVIVSNKIIITKVPEEKVKEFFKRINEN